MSVFLTIRCDGCNRDSGIQPTRNSSNTMLMLRNRLRLQGWEIAGKDVCPACVAKRRPAKKKGP